MLVWERQEVQEVPREGTLKIGARGPKLVHYRGSDAGLGLAFVERIEACAEPPRLVRLVGRLVQPQESSLGSSLNIRNQSGGTSSHEVSNPTACGPGGSPDPSGSS